MAIAPSPLATIAAAATIGRHLRFRPSSPWTHLRRRKASVVIDHIHRRRRNSSSSSRSASSMGAQIFAVVAAYVLSVVAGQHDYDRAAPLGAVAVAAARGTTPVDAAAERRLSADSCEESTTWRHTKKGKTHEGRTCAWVAEKPAKRCKAKIKSKDGVTAVSYTHLTLPTKRIV